MVSSHAWCMNRPCWQSCAGRDWTQVAVLICLHVPQSVIHEVLDALRMQTSGPTLLGKAVGLAGAATNLCITVPVPRSHCLRPRQLTRVRAHNKADDATPAPGLQIPLTELKSILGKEFTALMTAMDVKMTDLRKDLKKDQRRMEDMLGASLEYNVQQKRGLLESRTLINTLHIADCLVAVDGAQRPPQVLACAQALSYVLTEVGMLVGAPGRWSTRQSARAAAGRQQLRAWCLCVVA